MLRYVLYLALLFPQGPNCGCEQKPEINVLAVVNGVKITRKDLSIDTQTDVSVAQDTVIFARSRQLESKINDVLLEMEAKRRGITAAELLETGVTSKITPPTEAEAKAIYEQGYNRKQSFSTVKNQIIAQLRSERVAARVREFANTLRAGAKIEIANPRVTPPTNEAELARVFATVNGVNITSSDIETALLPLIFKVQQQVYDLRKRDLDRHINDLLLEQEAKKLGSTPQALIYSHVNNAKIPIVTEKQARAYYEANKAQIKQDFSEVKMFLIYYLEQLERWKVLSAYLEQLRNESAVQIYLTEPKPPNVRQLCCNLVG